MGSGDKRLLGTWKLQSCTFVDAETGEQSNPLGIYPVGYINYSSDGRMMVMTFADNRQAPLGPILSDSEMVALFKTMVAYAGTFTVEGDEVTHNVDASWNQAWTGTQQTRFYKLDGSILTLTTPPMRSPLGAPIGIFTLVLERIE